MTTALSTELYKFRGGRGILVAVATGIVMIVMASVGTAQRLADQSPAGAEAAESIIRQGFAGLLFASIAGALLVTGEYRHRTWPRTYLTTPHRGKVLAAKTVMAFLTGIPIGVLSVLGSTIVATVSGYGPANTWQTWRLFLAIVLVSALAGPWGVALGYLMRNQVATVLVLVCYSVGIEAVLIVIAPAFGRFLPGGAQLSLLHDPELTLPLPSWAALVLLTAYIAVALACAWRRERTGEAL
ncbi:ABC transporter permease [Streptomyces chrestomyceticus]|uniref:ABC transporter permease n=1 Tax=Streptomyces chrestomyceticus TaxID=68185 RepID=UPI0035A86718